MLVSLVSRCICNFPLSATLSDDTVHYVIHFFFFYVPQQVCFHNSLSFTFIYFIRVFFLGMYFTCTLLKEVCREYWYWSIGGVLVTIAATIVFILIPNKLVSLVICGCNFCLLLFFFFLNNFCMHHLYSSLSIIVGHFGHNIIHFCFCTLKGLALIVFFYNIALYFLFVVSFLFWFAFYF